MTRTRFLLVLSCAAALGALVSATVPAVAGGNDVKKLEKLKADRDKFRKGLKAEGKMPFHDLSHAADPKKVQETRWTQTDPPPFQDVSEEKGGQFYAVWSPDITKGSPITLVIQKFIHKSPGSEWSMEFKHAGIKCKCAESDKMIEGFYLDKKREMKDVLEDKERTSPPKKKKLGPAEMLAYVTGVDPESQKRERHEYYMWTTANVTWIASIKYDDKVLDDPGILEKGAEMIKTIRELKPPE